MFSNCKKSPQWSAVGLYSYAEKNQTAYTGALSIYDFFSKKLFDLGYDDYNFALSIVFPEFMRYSAFQDKMETFVTNILYSNNLTSSGYSIGTFQMKPIFAQDLEKIVSNSQALKKKYPLIDFAGKTERIEDRRERIFRLQDPKCQIQYLYAFIEICTEKFQLESMSDEEKLTYLATAYNSGFMKSKEQIEKLSKINTFPHGQGNNNSKWNYSTIAKEFYRSRLLSNSNQ